jgi:hypothetical protein
MLTLYDQVMERQGILAPQLPVSSNGLECVALHYHPQVAHVSCSYFTLGTWFWGYHVALWLNFEAEGVLAGDSLIVAQSLGPSLFPSLSSRYMSSG